MIKKAVEKGLKKKLIFRNKAFSCEIYGEIFTSTINAEIHIIAVHLEIKLLVANFVEKHLHPRWLIGEI